MNLEEKLKIVAEFDDAISWDKERELWFNEARNNNSGGWQEYLAYKTDYNELHRVWVRFRDLKLKKDNLKDGQALHRTLIRNAITDLPIEKAFEKLTEALIWYNSIK